MPIGNIDNDEQFERYLRRFRPLAPESIKTRKHARDKGRLLVFAAWGAVTAVVVMAGLLILHHPTKPTRPARGIATMTAVKQPANPQPLTIGSANALLAHAPSFNEAVDLVAFQSQATQLPEGAQSALAVLSKEDTKL